MRPFIWRGDISKRWFVAESREAIDLPDGAPIGNLGGYLSWREAMHAVRDLLIGEPT